MATATCCESREPGEVGGASRRRLSDLETNLVMQGWNVWTRAEEGKWIYWPKDVRQEEKGKNTEKIHGSGGRRGERWCDRGEC